MLSCEQARDLLPEYAERRVHAAGDLEIHLASCAACRAELKAYRSLLAALAELRDAGPAPPAGFEGRVLADVPDLSLRRRVRETLSERRRWIAIASIGGAAIGVTALGAIALVRHRRHRAAAVAGG
jgi:predicted anti-sigma-YlaC factor YlaD